MQHNKDNAFDLSLQKELPVEKAVAEFLTELGKAYTNQVTKLEVKSDYKTWETGNIFVEVQCRGKPSCLSITKAEFYVFNVPPFLYLVPVPLLKNICLKYPTLTKGGDDNASLGHLIPIQEFTNLIYLNQFETMSNYQKKDGDISVFTNQSANANAPRWKGNLLLNGQEYTVSLWSKNGAKGEFLAGSVQPKQAPVANTYNQYDQGNDPF